MSTTANHKVSAASSYTRRIRCSSKIAGCASIASSIGRHFSNRYSDTQRSFSALRLYLRPQRFQHRAERFVRRNKMYFQIAQRCLVQPLPALLQSLAQQGSRRLGLAEQEGAIGLN